MTSSVAKQEGAEHARIMLELLAELERDGAKSQRRLAADLGIALGLLNAYLRRCVHKGLVKVAEVPARRYVYYLTPQGFAEKSRLTVEYLSSSFAFFRKAKADCQLIFDLAKQRGHSAVVLAGVSELAEICTLCARDVGISIVAIVDGKAGAARHVGVPVVADYESVQDSFDAIVVTDQNATAQTIADAVTQLCAEQVFVPPLLGMASQSEVAQDDR